MKLEIKDVVIRGIPMKLINYKYKGTYRKVKFHTQEAAEEWKRAFVMSLGEGTTENVAEYTIRQIDDINAALAMLPEKSSLKDCVKSYLDQLKYTKDLVDAKKEFLAAKKPTVSKDHYTHIKSRLGKFEKQFKTFDGISSGEILSFCKSLPASKTQLHYFNILKEFFGFCQTKDYINKNPFDKIHDSEIPKVGRKEHKIMSVDAAKTVFANIELMRPELSGLFALVAFGGLRLKEATRLVAGDFDFEHKEIILPFKKSKTGQTWLQANMPDNVWVWLEKYPPNDSWQCAHPERVIKNDKTALGLEDNALRHAFATYHLSLYREAHKTQILMRHTNPNMLWQTYLAGLTDEKTAQAYFNIKPSK